MFNEKKTALNIFHNKTHNLIEVLHPDLDLSCFDSILGACIFHIGSRSAFWLCFLNMCILSKHFANDQFPNYALICSDFQYFYAAKSILVFSFVRTVV